ncbi:MAG: hypothetical protein Q8K79_20085, partial [Solirubrobacteraceae bacterium]|nr:hypothetical protein [Solirubrobacteraceae bacterium]
MDDPKELGVHLLRRAGPDEDLIGEVASVMEYQDASEQAAGSWKASRAARSRRDPPPGDQDEAAAEAILRRR